MYAIPGKRVNNNQQSHDYDQFLVEFEKAVRPDFSDDDYRKLCHRYASFFMFTGDRVPEGNYPFKKLKSEPIYLQNINRLLHSSNASQRILAYTTAAALGDTSYNNLLLGAMKFDPSKECRNYACAALLRLRDSHTEILFDYLVENEDAAPLLAMYCFLDKSALQSIAYKKVKSKNDTAKIFAVQSLSVTELNPKTDEVLRESIADWPVAMKRHAIDTSRFLKLGDLKDLLFSYIQDETLRGSCLAALACSPTQSDQEFLSNLVPPVGTVPDDILNAYLKSTNEAAVRYWLTLVRDREVSAEYFFSTYSQQLLLSDSFLDLVRDTSERTKNSNVRRELSRALAGMAKR